MSEACPVSATRRTLPESARVDPGVHVEPGGDTAPGV